jgi:hypothetical protein
MTKSNLHLELAEDLMDTNFHEVFNNSNVEKIIDTLKALIISVKNNDKVSVDIFAKNLLNDFTYSALELTQNEYNDLTLPKRDAMWESGHSMKDFI